MKPALPALLLAAALAPLRAETLAEQAVSLNIIGLATGTGNATYEKALGTDYSFTAGLNFASLGGDSAAGAQGGFRWWFDGLRPLQGWYAGPLLGAGGASVGGASAAVFLAGGEGGYQFVFDNRFVASMGLGVSYWSVSLKSKSGNNLSGVQRALNLSVGYAF